MESESEPHAPLDYLRRLTTKGRRILRKAEDEAVTLGHPTVDAAHILMAILRSPNTAAGRVILEFTSDLAPLQDSVRAHLGAGGDRRPGRRPLSAQARDALKTAALEAESMGVRFIGTEHLLLGVLATQPAGAAAPLLPGMDLSGLRARIEAAYRPGTGGADASGPGGRPARGRGRGRGDGRSVLAKFGKDFTAAAQAGGLDPVIGRRQEMERVIEILLRRSKNNPVLVGDAGVGKTAVVEGLAQRIAAGDVPAELRAKRLIALNLPSVIAGTKYRGEFEERIQQLVQEIREAADVILFIDELHTVIGAGGAAGSLDAANMLKSHLARGEVRVIGATTWREYRRYIAGDKSLTRRFQPVEIVEPNEADAVQIMHGLRGVYEDFHGVHIADEALEAAVTMSRRYLTARQLPDKAIDLIDEAAAQAKVLRLTAPDRIRQLEQRVQAFEAQRAATETPSDPGAAAELLAAIERLRAELRDEREAWRREIEATRPTVGKHEVAAVLSKWSGVPLPVLEMTESSRFLGLEQSLQRRIVGQDDALMELGRALRRAVAGLRDPMLPIGSFLMLGETGVGKTETAKALAEFISGAETGLMRVDMSEFSEWHNVSRLVGAPPGYVGYDQAGELTEAVRRSPFSVVLFDDVEKAHPRTLQVLLQIMDDGRLTDANGRHVSFRNTIVVMTSNLGVDAMRAPKIGYGTSAEAVRHHAAFEARMRDEARMHLPAEFLNRIDRVLIFRALSEEDVREITRRALSDAVARAAKVGIELTVTAEALDFLVRSAHARSQGGRPVRQLVGRYVDEPLTDLLVKGQAAGRQVDVQVVAGEPALVDRSRETPSDAEAAALHS